MRALVDYCDQLTNCTSLAGVGEVFHRGVAAQGYTASICSVFEPTGGRPQVRLMFRDQPRSWLAFADQQQVGVRSPALHAARRRLASFTFLDVFEALPSEQREIWHAVRAWGWQNGFVVPVHGPSGYFSYISIASPERDLNLSFSNRAEIQMFALLAHQRCHELGRPAIPEDPRGALSGRELECLRWVAAGKTDWETGMILSISATTVKFHVDSARRKLGASTRPQAVAILAVRGML
jgi:LuxR family quorum sensing-dependent transcriptional regulator